MLHRIVVNVINVPGEIVVIADGVFPVTPLPKRKFTIRMALEIDACSEEVGAEISLDPTPAPSEIGVSFRQRQDRVQVIRQNHHRIDRKRPFLSGHAKRGAKRADMIDQNR